MACVFTVKFTPIFAHSLLRAEALSSTGNHCYFPRMPRSPRDSAKSNVRRVSIPGILGDTVRQRFLQFRYPGLSPFGLEPSRLEEANRSLAKIASQTRPEQRRQIDWSEATALQRSGRVNEP